MFFDTAPADLTIGEIRHIQLEILDAVVACCEQHGLRYILTYGTLLGAVRHKGYIPWDDDIDLFMPRPDYDRFGELFNTLQSRYRFVNSDIDKYFPYPFAKVDDPTTYVEEFADYTYTFGVNLDIFPVDGLPEDPDIAAKWAKEMARRRLLRDFKVGRYKPERGWKKNVILILGKIALSPFPFRYFVARYVKRSRRLPFGHGEFVAEWSFQKGKRRFEKDYFDDTILVEFEGRMLRAPRKYDEMLTMIFGDYMTLPPEKERVTNHNYKAYRKPEA